MKAFFVSALFIFTFCIIGCGKKATVTALQVSGTPQSVIRGRATLLTSTDYTFEVGPAYPYVPADNSLSLRVHGPGSSYTGWWFIWLRAPNNAVLSTGTYTATRWPFETAGVAGFDFSANGSGTNRSNSIFDIKQLDRDAAGNITALALNWRQIEEVPSGITEGQFRYHSSIPLAVPAKK